jgi:hypothetical protein
MALKPSTGCRVPNPTLCLARRSAGDARHIANTDEAPIVDLERYPEPVPAPRLGESCRAIVHRKEKPPAEIWVFARLMWFVQFDAG